MPAPQKINGVPVEIIAGAVEEIEKREGGPCHPSRLVAAARSKRSPLHPLFEWDDTKAAEQWRVHQARRVINVIPLLDEKSGEEIGPRFVHVRKMTEEGVAEGYMSTVRALSTETREGVLADALAQMRGLRNRYKQLSELQKVWDALDEIEEAIAA